MVKYIRADSSDLMEGLTANVTTAESITSQLMQGSNQLIQAVNGEELSGAAYTAAQGLFKDLILPTVERVDSAIDAIKEEQVKYQAADGLVNRWAVIDETIQNELIQSLQNQVNYINVQIEFNNQRSLVGKLIQDVLEAIFNTNSKLEQTRDDLKDTIKEEQEKLEALTEFQAETSGLFQDSLSQLKIGMQAIELLGLTTVHPDTGAYQLPEGFDSSWFTTLKSMSVTETRKQVSLRNAMDELQLPEAAKKYYEEIMKEALKDVPVDQWEQAIQELNQFLMFDEEGNILRVLPVNFGMGEGIIILKNGVNDPELTSIANQEFDANQRELLLENLGQLALGLTEAIGGLGIMGLDLAGTYFSGGTLALVGMSQLAAVTGGTVTSAGLVTLTDAISRMGVASSTVSFSFAQNYGEYQKNYTPNQINKQIDSGKAPKGVKRADKGFSDVEDAQDHIHFDDSRWTLNRDGTWGHNSSGQPPKMTKKILKWLQDIGWKLP